MKASNRIYIPQSPSEYKKYLSDDGFRKYIWPTIWARWCLRRATHVGMKVRVRGWPSIDNNGTLIVGDRVRLVSTVATLELAVVGGILEICEGTFINYGCSIAAQKLVRIGPNCRIGTYVMITDNNFHSLEVDHRDELPESDPVILEENVWLGGRVILLPGVTIGMGSVIGAGSVVTHAIPPRSLAVGVPARVIKEL